MIGGLYTISHSFVIDNTLVRSSIEKKKSYYVLEKCINSNGQLQVQCGLCAIWTSSVPTVWPYHCYELIASFTDNWSH